jgi:hypothetical protein
MSELISKEGNILNLKHGNSVSLSLFKKAVSHPINATIGGLVALWGIGIIPPGNMIMNKSITNSMELFMFWFDLYNQTYN